MNQFQVIKRDGSIEDYQEEKIAKVLIAADLDREKAQKIAAGITAWIKKLNSAKLTSLQIRDKVIAQLKLTNRYVAGLFEWYEKTKDRTA